MWELSAPNLNKTHDHRVFNFLLYCSDPFSTFSSLLMLPNPWHGQPLPPFHRKLCWGHMEMKGEQLAAFDRVKMCFTGATTVAFPCANPQLSLMVDASRTMNDDVLSQLRQQ